MSQLLVRSDNIAARLFEGSMLVITPEDSVLHRFNEVGTFIWQLLETPHDIDSICREVAGHFSGFDPGNGRRQIERFIADLAGKRLVVPSS